MPLRLQHRPGFMPLRLHYRYIHHARAEALAVKGLPRSSSFSHGVRRDGADVTAARPRPLADSKRLLGGRPRCTRPA
ncbi:hypothetical protein BDV93DRAFT_521433 [Ceratobasidium sp. AG-I]|nr:hypothetical protein BDV93DRAFT_521433 [Ceratobasidium sp. AG-I]